MIKENAVNIRNFCIIAHIDHGKSTLADRFLEITKTVDSRKMKEQVLDQMDLEREKGITIKLQPVRMEYQGHVLNLIDTPGHVDFTYEVSRSLAAVEAAVLLVDATQGIEAQTIANLYLALEQNLKIIPVINKIDLPAAKTDAVGRDIKRLLGSDEEIIAISAKTGENTKKILDKIIFQVCPPKELSDDKLQALIFDSVYDDYLGVIAYIRIVSGRIKINDQVRLIAANKTAPVLELGWFKPDRLKVKELRSGEIGYIVTGVKELDRVKVGDTVTSATNPAGPLAGYHEFKPMVYAGFFPFEGDDYPKLRAALEKLKLNDAALIYESENSLALGYGFRCGFLGLLHLEIIHQRLIREFDLNLIITPPSVAYKIDLNNRTTVTIKGPQELPDPVKISLISEPYVKLDVIAPKQYLGSIMSLLQEKRGIYQTTEYLENERIILHYLMPMSMILTDFYDNLKSISSGYASMNYEFSAYQPANLVKMDILVAEEPVEAFSSIVYKDDAFTVGRKIVRELKEILPKQQFVVKIQAAIGGKIIAAERLSARRKDVTAKLYGGDVTRKRKLLEKQKKGKKKMAKHGKVDIPQEAFWAIMKR